MLDEPNETFTITLSESDANGDLWAPTTLMDFIVEDHADDLPPLRKISRC